jgi:hypothetical protein
MNYCSLLPRLAKINYFILDFIKIKNYRRFVPKISRIMPVKCLKFGKLVFALPSY